MDEFVLSSDLDADFGVFTVRVTGDVDSCTAGFIAQAVANRPRHVPDCVIDLSGVTFLDSSGIKVLFEILRSLQEASVTLRLAGISERVRRVLQIAGVEGVLGLGPNNGSAQLLGAPR
jgi:anti-sigma B factor antagonist